MAQSPQIPAGLRALAADSGIVLEYLDATGVRRCAEAEVVLAVLNALGVPIRRTTDAARLLRSRRSARVERIVEPVTVVDDASVGNVLVALREADTDLECAIESEDGERLGWRIHRDDLVSLARERSDGRDIYRGAVPLPSLLQCGYHTFSVRVRGRVGTSTVIVAPGGGARGRFGKDWRAFGIFVPLFSLHSARSWGSGDLTDLDELARFAAKEQASVVATLPLLAGFGPEPFEASPYLPVSRRFWHERWIDVERVPEYAWSPQARVLGSGSQATDRRDAWVKGAIVDGAAVTAAKRAALSAMATEVGRSGAGRETALRNFMFDRPDLVEYARFRAAVDRFGIELVQLARATSWRPARLERRRPSQRELSHLRPVDRAPADGRDVRAPVTARASTRPRLARGHPPLRLRRLAPSRHVRDRYDGRISARWFLRSGPVVGLPTATARGAPGRGTRGFARRAYASPERGRHAADRSHNGPAKAVLDPSRR